MGDSAAIKLEREFDSLMIITEDGLIVFSTPAEALRKTVLGDPTAYWMASMRMLVAEEEYHYQQIVSQEEGDT